MSRAKAAMPVAGEPLIRRIVRWLAAHAVTDLVLNLHHRPETISSIVGDGSDLGARIRYSWEQPIILGSAGGPRQALPIVNADTFFLINGDTLTNLDLHAMAAAHAASGALVTMALVPNIEFHRYGGVKVAGQNWIVGFARRGPDSEATGHFIGVQVVSSSVFRHLPEHTMIQTVGGIYDELIRRQPGAVRAFFSDADFRDVGTAQDYLRTSRALSTAPFDAGQRVRIDSTARITDSILWDDVEVGSHAVVDECIVADGVQIPAGANYQRSILMRRDEDGVAVFPLDA
jgi:NDP-sugar pyrophosphorylase family protein